MMRMLSRMIEPVPRWCEEQPAKIRTGWICMHVCGGKTSQKNSGIIGLYDWIMIEGEVPDLKPKQSAQVIHVFCDAL